MGLDQGIGAEESAAGVEGLFGERDRLAKSSRVIKKLD